MANFFEVQHMDGKARVGQLILPHGALETPVFMPVATAATLKGVLPRDAAEVPMLLANTFHLMLRPGVAEIKSYGGLHRFMQWSKPILTDSGGYQVFSLSALRVLDEQGVTFRSPLDGSRLFVSPESATEAQLDLGSDIIMCLDECTPYPVDSKDAAASMRLSTSWARRCKVVYDRRVRKKEQTKLFGIVQGGMYLDLRRTCLEMLVETGFDGYALGGLSVGEPKEEMLALVEEMAPRLPSDQPRYLMGVGTPSDLVEAVRRGMDLFDCVLPTRHARHGQLFTSRGSVNLRNAGHKGKQDPPDQNCSCYCCRHFSLGYLHHLFRCREMLGPQLASLHNIFYYQNLLSTMRAAIKSGILTTFTKHFYDEQSNN